MIQFNLQKLAMLSKMRNLVINSAETDSSHPTVKLRQLGPPVSASRIHIIW